MYEKSKTVMLKLACLLKENHWDVKALDFCKGSDFVLRLNGQTGKIEVVELDYCRAIDLLVVRDISPSAETARWKVAEFGDCNGLLQVLYTTDTTQRWLPISVGDCLASDVVFFKPNGSREWRSQTLGTCPANGSLLCFNEKDNSWDETTLGSCGMNSVILHYKAKPRIDIETLIKQIEDGQE